MSTENYKIQWTNTALGFIFYVSWKKRTAGWWWEEGGWGHGLYKDKPDTTQQ